MGPDLVSTCKAYDYPIWCALSASAPLSRLCKLCLSGPQGSGYYWYLFNIGLHRENLNIFFSQTVRPGVTKFGVQHYLVHLYKDGSNFAP